MMEDNIKTLQNWLGKGSINIFGMPFAGKDTQGGVLADLFGAELMGGGQILRNSVIPADIKEHLDAGNLFPTEDYLRIVLPYLSSQKFADRPLILSAVGRWHGEELGVIEAAEASGHPLKAVILLTVPEEIARLRHANAYIAADRGDRADDAPEVFDNRLNEFRQKTLPVIEFYRERGLLIEIDGSASPVSVTDSILSALMAYQLNQT